MKMDKKGQTGQLVPLITGLVVIGLVLVVSFLILGEIAANATVVADENASSAVTETQQAMDQIPGWLGIIVITVIGAILIGLIAFFAKRA